MSKLCMQRREKRRERLSKKFQARRDDLLKIVRSLNTTLAEKEQAQSELQKLPKDSIPCRRRRRCWETGRANGVYRIVGLCRNMFRKRAMDGDIPGLHKASW